MCLPLDQIQPCGALDAPLAATTEALEDVTMALADTLLMSTVIGLV